MNTHPRYLTSTMNWLCCQRAKILLAWFAASIAHRDADNVEVDVVIETLPLGEGLWAVPLSTLWGKQGGRLGQPSTW